MFCQHCGNEIRQGLNYCNRCGARSVTDLERSSLLVKRDTLTRNLSVAVGVTGFAGIMGLGYTINQLILRGEIPPPAFLLVLLLGVVILGVVITLSVLISVLHRRSSAIIDIPQFGANDSPKQMSKTQTAQLPEPHQTFISVTENTTRTFEPVFVPKQES
jgi:hypothetical protein